MGRKMSNQRSELAYSWEFAFSTEYVGSWPAGQTSCVGKRRGRVGEVITSPRIGCFL